MKTTDPTAHLKKWQLKWLATPQGAGGQPTVTSTYHTVAFKFLSVFQAFREVSTLQRSLSSSEDVTWTAEGTTFQLNISLHSLCASKNFLSVY